MFLDALRSTLTDSSPAAKERKTWIGRRAALSPVAESYANAIGVHPANRSEFVISYLKKAELLRELLLFVNRQITFPNNDCFCAPESPPPDYVC